jgi:hypothetical protein
VFPGFCFATRKKIRKRLQPLIEALQIADICLINQQKERKSSAFNVEMSEKER